MARRKLYIPDEVKTDIKKELGEKCLSALDGYSSASEEEDALTGDLGASLRVKNRKVFVKNSELERPGDWNWSLDYRKLRGRGPGATEKVVGADGLFELRLQNGGVVETKSLLFQAKNNLRSSKILIEEAMKMTTWREAAFVLNFTPSRYEAIELDNIIKSRGIRNESSVIPLDEFIGTRFLDCVVGDVDLRYDATRRRLIWRSTGGQMVAANFAVQHRFSINISAPSAGEYFVEKDKIHEYRMLSSPEDILSLNQGYDSKELSSAKRNKSLVYHPDSFEKSDAFIKEMAKKRQQEVNSAYEELFLRIKK